MKSALTRRETHNESSLRSVEFRIERNQNICVLIKNSASAGCHTDFCQHINEGKAIGHTIISKGKMQIYTVILQEIR